MRNHSANASPKFTAKDKENNEKKITASEVIPIFRNEFGSRTGLLAKMIRAIRQKIEIAMTLGLRSGSIAEGTIRKGRRTNKKAKKKVAVLSVFTFRHIFSSSYRITVQFTKSFEKL